MRIDDGCWREVRVKVLGDGEGGIVVQGWIGVWSG